MSAKYYYNTQIYKNFLLLIDPRCLHSQKHSSIYSPRQYNYFIQCTLNNKLLKTKIPLIILKINMYYFHFTLQEPC